MQTARRWVIQVNLICPWGGKGLDRKDEGSTVRHGDKMLEDTARVAILLSGNDGNEYEWQEKQ